MSARRSVPPLATAMATFFGGCGASEAPRAGPPSSAAAAASAAAPSVAPSLVGTWRSKEYMSQLGPTTQTLTFHADGTYALELVMKAMPATPMRSQGPYRLEAERVTFGEGSEATSSTIAWKDGDLVLTERNGDRYTLSRVPAK